MPRVIMTRGSDSARPPRCFSGNIPLDARALGEAFRREAPMLVAAARAIVLDDAEAEDLVEVTFEIAIRRIADLRDPLALR